MLRKTKIKNGWVEGLPAADPRITSFKGIPFAAPPVGENRWRAPQPAADWEGVLPCYKFGPIAMQNVPGVYKEDIYTREWNVDVDIPMDEDCLQLNVWTPAKTGDERLPVFVWYFGGGLQVGNPAEMEFDGERLARRGLVVVTINYRVNVFGFLCHPEITAEAPAAPANFGNLDQQFATRWVKDNIAAFGGDPENITIGGQSAGGGSVMTQLTSPQNQGLFQKAIIDSGMGGSPYPGGRFPRSGRTLKDAEEAGVAFFEYLGVKTLAEARAIPAAELRDKAVAYKGFWGTIIDGNFCVGEAYELILKNQRLMVPILAGHTSAEFPSTPDVNSIDEFNALAKELFGEDANEFLALCDLQFDSVTEAKKKATVTGFEYALRVAGQTNAETGLPFYTYNFDPFIPGWDNPGAFHSVDLWFFFETLAKCWRPFTGEHYDLARLMCNYWAEFIKKGDPNGRDADGTKMPAWTPMTPENPNSMYFSDTLVGMEEDGPSDLMAFLVRQRFKK